MENPLLMWIRSHYSDFTEKSQLKKPKGCTFIYSCNIPTEKYIRPLEMQQWSEPPTSVLLILTFTRASFLPQKHTHTHTLTVTSLPLFFPFALWLSPVFITSPPDKHPNINKQKDEGWCSPAMGCPTCKREMRYSTNTTKSIKSHRLIKSDQNLFWVWLPF